MTLTLTVAGVGVEGFTVTVAYAFASSSAALLATTVTEVGTGTDGAVSRPVLEIEPALVTQTTDVLLVPLTVAANCCVAPAGTVALVGFKLTVILVDAGGLTVTVTEAFESIEATLDAVTVTYEIVETLGAVSNPVLEIEPALVDHVTFELLDPLTAAENCWVAPEATVALVGEI